MAVSAPTKLFEANSGSSGYVANSFQTANFTTVSNTFLVAVAAISGVSGSDTTSWTNTSIAATTFVTSGLTWTTRMGYVSPAATGQQVSVAVGTANVVTGSATANILYSYANTGVAAAGLARDIVVLSFTGVDWTTPVGGTAANIGLSSNGAATATLSQTPVTTSCVLGMRICNFNGSGGAANAAASWTVDYNDILPNGWLGLEVQHINNYSSTSVSWQQTILGDTVAGSSETLLGLELLAAATATANPGIMIGL